MGCSSSKDTDPAEPVASKQAAAPPSAEQPADDSSSKDPEPSEFMGCYHGGYYPTVDLKLCQDMRAELRQKEMDDDSHNDGLCYIGLKYFYGTWKLEVQGKRRPVVSVTFACMREGSASTFGGATVGEKDIDSWKQRPVSEACAFGAGVLAPLPGSESFQPACDMKKTPSEPHLAVPEDLAIAFEAPAQPAQGEPPEGSGDSEASVAGTYGPVGAPQMELREDGRIKHTSPRLIRHGTWQLVHPRILEVHWTESIELDADGAEESKSQTDRLEGMYYGGKVIRTSGTGGIFNREGA